jgi:hypothetical protein
VSDRTVPDIDPRFDPRFQRGYVPDATAPGPDPIPSHRPPDRAAPVTGFGDSVDTPQGPVATRGEAVESPNPVTDTEGVTDAGAADAGADDPAAAILGLLAHAQAERFARADPERDVTPADDWRAEPDSPAFTQAAQPEHDAEPMVNASPANWFWIALAACVVFIVVGVALFWNGASDRSMFTGIRSGLEGAFNQFSMILAPGLVQAGVLGSVVVLVVWAITGRRSRMVAE